MKGIELIINQDEYTLNNEFETDINRFMQILMNLVSNAFKFTTKGYIKITLNTILTLNVEYVEVIIEDTGIGIKEENLEKLFKLFG